MGKAGLIADAVRALDAGGLVVFPTETVYGIGCAPGDEHRLREAKGREEGKPFQLLLPDVSWASKVAVPDERLDRLGPLMPGPLTVVLPGLRGGTVGVRVPDHPVALSLLAAAGPVVASSANRAGRPPPGTVDGVREVFGESVQVYLDGAPAPAGLSSTVLDLTGPARILRAGAVPAGTIERLLGAPVAS